MKIEESKQPQATVAVEELGQGKCFTLPDQPISACYMVVAVQGSLSLNAVHLLNGNVVCFGRITRVIPLPEGTFLPYGK